jgi:hypothetical protein
VPSGDEIKDTIVDLKRRITRLEHKTRPEVLGVLQLGNYPDPGFALGDAGNKYSYGCNVIYQEVEGLSFRLCQMGYETPDGEKLKKSFNLIDKNGNGRLDKHELQAFLTRIGKDKTEAEIEEIIKACEKPGDHDGKLDFEEFCNGCDSFMPSVDEAFEKAIRILESKGVVAITADCGFFVQYNRHARRVAKVPVMLSSVCQIPQVELIIDRNAKFVIFTANATSFDKPAMHEIMSKLGSDDEKDQAGRAIIIGIQDLPGVEAINLGLTEDVKLLGDGICSKFAQQLKENPNIKAVLLECTMMGPYANRLRSQFKIPVFDCITAADTLLNSVRQHDRLVVENPGVDWTR